mgnify:CR=1 FL=1
MENNNNISSLNLDFDFRTAILIIRRNFWWFFIFAGINIAVLFLYLRYTPPMYSASSVIQLAGENKANEYLKVKDIYEHENLDAYIELMRSPEFLKRVLNKLHYDVAYYAQGKFLTNEHYENSVYTVNYEVINAAVKGTKFDINFNNQDNATISYSFNNQIGRAHV